MQVYDTAAHQRIFTIKRPASAAKTPHARPHLYWEADSLLYVGWAATVTVCALLHLSCSSAQLFGMVHGAIASIGLCKNPVCRGGMSRGIDTDG